MAKKNTDMVSALSIHAANQEAGAIEEIELTTPEFSIVEPEETIETKSVACPACGHSPLRSFAPINGVEFLECEHCGTLQSATTQTGIAEERPVSEELLASLSKYGSVHVFNYGDAASETYDVVIVNHVLSHELPANLPSATFYVFTNNFRADRSKESILSQQDVKPGHSFLPSRAGLHILLRNNGFAFEHEYDPRTVVYRKL